MHAIELARLANTYVHNSESQIAMKAAPPPRAIDSYWLTNRFRHEHWSGRLASHRASIQTAGVSFRNACWREITPVIQEVFLSEPLTRCIAYHAAVLEQEKINFDFAPLATSTLASHAEARHRCLHLIVFGAGLPIELAVELNRLRRVMESYNEQLLSCMRPLENADAYSFDAPTMQDAQQQLSTAAQQNACRHLHTSAIGQWFTRSVASELDHRPASARLNARLAEATLELLPATLFDSFGVAMSPVAARRNAGSAECSSSFISDEHLASSPLSLLHPVVNRPAMLHGSEKRW